MSYLEEAVVNNEGDEEGGGVGVQGEGGGERELRGVGVEQQQQRHHRLLGAHYHRTGKV